MALVQSPFVLYILFSMHCTVPNMHAKQQNHQQKKNSESKEKKKKNPSRFRNKIIFNSHNRQLIY